MIPRRAALRLAPALLAAPALLRPSAARAQEVTLRLHHFLPAVSNVHRHFLMRAFLDSLDRREIHDTAHGGTAP